MVCFLLTLEMTACSLGKSNDKQEEETAVEVTVDQAEETKKEKTDKASADKKDDKSNKKDDKKNDSADKNADKKNDKKNTVKADDKSGKSEGNNNTGGNGGGSYSDNGGSTVVYVEQPKQEQPKTEEPKQEQPKVEKPKQEQPKVEEPKQEEPKTEEPKTEEPKTEEPKTEEPKTEEPKTEEPTTEEPKLTEQRIEFSGDPDDVVVIDVKSYYEGEKFVLYLGEGCKVHGDIAIQFATIMDEIENWYGLKYADYTFQGDSDWREFYYDGAFQGINTDCSKVNILLRVDPQNGEVECASSNMTVLFDEDMDPENGNIDIAYHELTHVLRLRQSNSMGDIFEEGVATYTQYKYAMEKHLPMWPVYIYTRDDSWLYPFDESVIFADAEQAFRDIENSERDIYQKEYQYGIRFVYFLIEEYGDGVIRDISMAAKKNNLEYDDVDQTIRAIKEGTSEDVFERFSAWLPDGWDKFTEDYNNYMKEFDDYY